MFLSIYGNCIWHNPPINAYWVQICLKKPTKGWRSECKISGLCNFKKTGEKRQAAFHEIPSKILVNIFTALLRALKSMVKYVNMKIIYTSSLDKRDCKNRIKGR